MPSLTTHELFRTGLQLLHAAHQQGSEQAAANLETASSSKLRRALRSGIAENKKQIKRLEEVFEAASLPVAERDSAAMEGIANENNRLAAEARSTTERDLIHIAYGQLSAHFYLAQYGTVRAYARALGNKKAVKLLSKTLNGSAVLDKMLTVLAKDIRTHDKQSDPKERETSSAFGTVLHAAGLLSLAAVGTVVYQSIGTGHSSAPSTNFYR